MKKWLKSDIYKLNKELDNADNKQEVPFYTEEKDKERRYNILRRRGNEVEITYENYLKQIKDE